MLIHTSHWGAVALTGIGDAHAASVSEMASADRPQSDTQWRWKTGLRSRDGGAIGLTGLHVQPRLAVGDMSARQAADPSREEESDAAPNRSDRQTTTVCPLGKTRPPGGSLTSVGLRLPPSAYPRRHSHPDCRSPLTLIVARQCCVPELLARADEVIE